ncbi:MAG: PDZ domain-containing protein, partial [Deltaproteobacteria bacterium]|nr:PDZ domain-containing protein [Deltaproteobacteria bacterium]
HLFGPLIDLLKKMNCNIIQDEEATDTDLSKGAVIFLGTEGRTCRSLFGRPLHPAAGFTLDVRKNPLARTRAAVLVTAHNRRDVSKVVAKLSHYGKYGFLHFEEGRIREKRIPETSVGQRYPIDPAPRGIELEQTRSFDDIVKQLLEKRVIYIGESHTSYEDHRLQLRIIRALYEQDPRLAIGMEMFPQAAQPVLDDYLARGLKERAFLKKSGYFRRWGYDYRLYREIIDFARSRHIPIKALNLEKEIVSNVFKGGGMSALSQEERNGLPWDRDLDVPGYRERLEPVYRMHSSDGVSGRFADFLQAQALWDETMAERVVAYLAAHPGRRMVVLAGNGHVIKDTGVPQRVYGRMPVAQAVVLNKEGMELDPAGADFLFFSRPARLPPQARLGVVVKDQEAGVGVAGFTPHGRAKESGIKKGDIMVAIDDETLETVEDLKIIMLYKKRGDTARVRIRRARILLGDEDLEISVML